MKITEFMASASKEVVDLFVSVFTASENEEEGDMIGALVPTLIESTAPKDLMGFVAISSGKVVGCIFFSRFVVPSNQKAFLLSPVAVATNMQGKGIGQQLINHGLSHLKSISIEIVFTYGDPNYYSKVGFKPISEKMVSAPFKLSQPEGWLAQSLNGCAINPMEGTTTCVRAFNNPELW